MKINSLRCALALLALSSFCLGSQFRQPRLYGGYDVTPYYYPFVVAIAYGPDLIGNGAILSEYWVISAASTFLQTPDEHYVVRAGGNSFGEGERYQQGRIYRHPEFTGWDNNVALLKTARKMAFGARVRPITIAPEDPDKVIVLMVSYGENEHGNHHLRAGGYTLLGDPACAYKFDELQARQVIFKGHGYCMISPPSVKQGHAYNDAGGPLFAGKKLYGVFSGSETTNPVSNASMATRLGSYVNWVKDTMKKQAY